MIQARLCLVTGFPLVHQYLTSVVTGLGYLRKESVQKGSDGLVFALLGGLPWKKQPGLRT